MEKTVFVGVITNPEEPATGALEIFANYESAKAWVKDCTDAQLRLEKEGNAHVIYSYDKDVDTLEAPVLATRAWTSRKPLYITRTVAKDAMGKNNYVTERFVMEAPVK